MTSSLLAESYQPICVCIGRVASVLAELLCILNLIESVFEGFPSYSCPVSAKFVAHMIRTVFAI